MANIDEVLAAMPDTAAAAAIEYLTIDPVTRTITVPEASRIFGVTADEMAERKYFLCPRYVGDGLDLAGMFLTVYFRTATGYEDGYLVDDVAVSGEYVTFSWLLSESVTMHKGAVQFSVCADLPNTADKRRPDWNTTIATGEVLEGLDPDLGDVAGETSDVVAQLREMVTAQTAAVEATGATQVQAVQAAADAATADAQAQIEAKGAATLATIPADYTAMAVKVNEQANAIKGHLSGEIVQAGDVSPVEHFLDVKVRGRNLFNTGKFEPAENQADKIYVSAVEAGAITLYCPANHNGYCATGLTLREVCGNLTPGKVYTLSAATEAAGREYLYLNGANVTWWFGNPQTVTDEMLNSTIVLYSINGQNYGANYCTISNIQLEEGTVATEYTPYINPAGVTVTACGKNLFDLGTIDNYHRISEYTVITDGVLYGYVNSSSAGKCINLKNKFPNGTYAISYKYSDDTPRMLILPYDSEGNALTKCAELSAAGFQYNSSYGAFFTNVNTVVLTIPDTVANWCLGFAFPTNDHATGDIVEVTNVQVEKADTVTAYEPYNGATAMPDESGTVTGLPSAAPTMTLLTDTAGVTIDCTYNRDSNAVYAELLEKIAALSGTK